jgi:hypothetical protein
VKIRLILAVAGALTPAALGQDGPYRAVPIPPDAPRPVILPPTDGPGATLDWNTIDGGGGELTGALGYNLNGTVGQPDAGFMSGNGLELSGGYWNLPVEPPSCYANCDGSTGNPILTANDFVCFLNAFTAQEAYANCDGVAGLTANDFICFINAYSTGCS